ncbi:hypothetical protein LIPSTDRAFT_336090 [Lipomyces starkeyi NRRL Y-11557]|uniref:Uncharacterized protein n=1 Tax=Lipomyces starkeyi NRRL Y-11557 TaxID=675824 RepID=A0A1E3QCY6_LIPST|nr:hypothetical protein LIPSTDRAFT_336090 [Lipomyces starkeyi NRRL Y-11557]
METRGSRQDYLALNGGTILNLVQMTVFLTQFQMLQILVHSHHATPLVRQNSIERSIPFRIGITKYQSNYYRAARNGRKEVWFRNHFTRTEVHSEWYDSPTKRGNLSMQLSGVLSLTSKLVTNNWSTTDSKRQSFFTNITRHLREVHSILPLGAGHPVPASTATIISFLEKGKEKGSLTHQQILEKNIIR